MCRQFRHARLCRQSWRASYCRLQGNMELAAWQAHLCCEDLDSQSSWRHGKHGKRKPTDAVKTWSYNHGVRLCAGSHGVPPSAGNHGTPDCADNAGAPASAASRSLCTWRHGEHTAAVRTWSDNHGVPSCAGNSGMPVCARKAGAPATLPAPRESGAGGVASTLRL